MSSDQDDAEATLRLTALLVLLSLCGSAMGLGLEKRIHLSDTGRLPAVPRAFAYDGRDRTVFMGGFASNSILVLDESTIEPIERIDAGAPVLALACSRVIGKLQCLQKGSRDQEIEWWTAVGELAEHRHD